MSPEVVVSENQRQAAEFGLREAQWGFVSALAAGALACAAAFFAFVQSKAEADRASAAADRADLAQQAVTGALERPSGSWILSAAQSVAENEPVATIKFDSPAQRGRIEGTPPINVDDKGRFAVPLAGVYLVSASAYIAAAPEMPPVSFRRIEVRLNDRSSSSNDSDFDAAIVLQQSTTTGDQLNNSRNFTVSGSAVLYADKGDKISVVVDSDDGVPFTIDPTALSTWVSICLINRQVESTKQ